MNPILGVFYHWLGGLASGSFYVPFRGVKRWSWETAWLAAGVFSWIIAPWFFALLSTRDVVAVLAGTSGTTLLWSFFFGVLWGFGGITLGLTMRYLGMSLGMAVALGYCTFFGTLIPPLFKGEFHEKLLAAANGRWVLLGLAVCVAGIVVTALAGRAKEGKMTEENKKATVREFDFKKGLLVATFSGIMSACFAFGLSADNEIGKISLAHGTPAIWTGLPVLIVVLFGGFTTNFIWCVFLNLKNGTGYQYFTTQPGKYSPLSHDLVSAGEGAPVGDGKILDGRSDKSPVPLFRNYIFAAIAGATWYFQFFFYSMGESQIADYKFSSWTLHMASIIIFSSIWGLALHEWRGSSRKARRLLFLGLAILVLSTVIIGYGSYIGGHSVGH